MMNDMKSKYLYENVDYTALIKARNVLERISKNVKSEGEKMGVIQAFEICYELAWKTMKKILFIKGIDVNSPRDVFRESFKVGIINDAEKWLSYLVKRNITVHAYNKEILDDLFFNTAKEFLIDLNLLIFTIEKRAYD